ncbi:MAG: fibronectin type III domain-containing protein, partial [Elusimicrobiota bacterium]|nr:fibronectin type III domain-containing protein [Elusimicrobiota bacterium]
NSGLSSPNTSYYLADDNTKVAKLGYTPPPNAPSSLKQLTTLVGSTELASMQWTNSSTIISSFTQSSPAAGNLKFYLWITSVTTGGNAADWAQSWHASTSAYLSQGATQYNWPALTDNGTYWWRVWSEDINGFTSSTSTALAIDGNPAKLGFDNTAPAAITNLTALAGWKVDTVVLKWTAPQGGAATYLMRYSTASFSNSEWDAAWVKNLNEKATIPTPATSGVTEIMLLTGLTNGTSYWFAIKSQDAGGNTSAINSNTQDFAVAQTTYPIIINEIAPWQTSGLDGAEFYVKNKCYVGGLKLYGKDATGIAVEVVKTLPSIGGIWEEEIPAGTYIIIYMRTAGTDETTVGQSLANSLKIYAGATTPNDTDGLLGTDGYCALSDTAGLTVDGSYIITSGNILDFVAYQNQDQTGFADTYDDDNVNYAISKGQWVSTSTVTDGFDCVNSRRNGNTSSIARNNSSDKIYNSKYDWTYRYQSISTGAANGTIDPTSGGGVCAVTPATAQISTAGTWKFKYNGNSDDSLNHTVVLQVPSSWPQPQNTDATLSNYTTAFISTLADPPNPGDAGFTSGYGVTISQIIGTSAGWRVIVDVGAMAATDNLYIVYGATYTSTNGVVTAPADSGTYTFRVYSDTNGVNVSEIASSPQITVNESVAPAAISDLTALEGGDDGIVKLNWTSPGDDGVTGNLTGTFRIKYSSVSIISSGDFDAPSSFLAVITVNISTTALTPLTACTTTMYGLNPGTSYFFAIKTADDVSNWSVWNSSADVLTVNTSAYCAANDSVPPAPSNLVAQQGNQQITLTWTAVTGEPDLDFYRIYCDSTPPVAEEWYIVGTTPAVNTSYLHTGLTNNSTYNYKITAVDLGNTTSGYSTANESDYSNTYSTYPYSFTVVPKAALVYFSTGTTSPDNTTSQIPSMRNWDGAAFLSEETTVNMGGAVDLFTVVRMCPQSIRQETIVGVLDRSDAASSPDIDISTYTAANGWGTVKKISADSDVTTVRCFDIAYEQLSGDYIVVARTPNSTSVPWYSVNGAAPVAGPTHGAGTIQWVRLEPKPNFDEIILVTCDLNNDVYASVWNGSAWGNTQLLETDSISSAQSFDIAYTQSAGVGFVVWTANDSTRPKYRTWDGYSWSSSTTTSFDHFSTLGEGRNIKLAANPKNNELLLGSNCSGFDIDVEVWSSTLSVWLAGKKIDPVTRGLTIRTFDVAYEKSSGDGLVVYADAAGGIPKYVRWNTGGSGKWDDTTPASASDTGSSSTLNWVQLASDDQSDKIHLVTSDADNDINVQTWSGSAWGSINEVETNSDNSYESFFCRFPRPAAPSDTIAPAAVTSLCGLVVATSTGTIKLTWSAPGDDIWIGRLTNGSKYRITYTTSTENRVWYYWTQVSSPTGSDTIAPGAFLTTTISNLVGDATYYCKIWYWDEVNNEQTILSNEATAYASAPVLSVDIIIAEVSYAFGEVSLGASTQSVAGVSGSSITVKNDGNIVENFGIKCETNTANSPWFTTGTAAADDIFILKAVFHTTSQPAFTAFGNEDIVSSGTYKTSQTLAGGGRFTIDGSEDGVEVPVNDTIDLWLRLDMPTTSGTVAAQEIILYIRAESP